jgi:hypothetical protein
MMDLTFRAYSPISKEKFDFYLTNVDSFIMANSKTVDVVQETAYYKNFDTVCQIAKGNGRIVKSKLFKIQSVELSNPDSISVLYCFLFESLNIFSNFEEQKKSRRCERQDLREFEALETTNRLCTEF